MFKEKNIIYYNYINKHFNTIFNDKILVFSRKYFQRSN